MWYFNDNRNIINAVAHNLDKFRKLIDWNIA